MFYLNLFTTLNFICIEEWNTQFAQLVHTEPDRFYNPDVRNILRKVILFFIC